MGRKNEKKNSPFEKKRKTAKYVEAGQRDGQTAEHNL